MPGDKGVAKRLGKGAHMVEFEVTLSSHSGRQREYVKSSMEAARSLQTAPPSH